jgi:hypothetical protein
MEQNDNAVEVGHPVTNMLMREACAADLGAADHADAGGPTLDGVTGHGTESGSTGHVTEEGDALADHLLEIENLVEGARDAVVRRLEQFDNLDARAERIEWKLDRLLSILAPSDAPQPPTVVAGS